MKIGLVHLNLSTESGDPRMFFYIARQLKQLGHQIKIFTAEHDSSCFPDLQAGLDIEVVSPPRPLTSVFEKRSVFQKIKERLIRESLGTEAAFKILRKLPNDLDILICQNDQSYKLGFSYKQLLPSTRVVWIMNNAPFRHTRKDNFIVNMLSLLASWLEIFRVRRYMGGIDLVVVNDSEQKRIFSEKIGGRVVVLTIPVDFEKFSAPVKNVSKQDTISLLGIGALSPARKFEDIINTASGLKKAGYRVKVVLVCKNFWKDESYKEFLIGLVKKENLEDEVKFMFDGASEVELVRLIRSSHFFIFPNHVKIGSMAAFEAMAAGVPLLVSDSTSVAESLTDEENSFFFRPGAVDQIQDKIIRAVENPSLYARIAGNGQRFIKEKLSWEKYVADFVSEVTSS